MYSLLFVCGLRGILTKWNALKSAAALRSLYSHPNWFMRVIRCDSIGRCH